MNTTKRVEISFRGHIDENWSDRLGRMSITHLPDGNTILSGLVRDQSALYGLLNYLSNLGLDLVSVATLDTLSRNRKRRSDMED